MLLIRTPKGVVRVRARRIVEAPLLLQRLLGGRGGRVGLGLDPRAVSGLAGHGSREEDEEREGGADHASDAGGDGEEVHPQTDESKVLLGKRRGMTERGEGHIRAPVDGVRPVDAVYGKDQHGDHEEQTKGDAYELRRVPKLSVSTSSQALTPL